MAVLAVTGSHYGKETGKMGLIYDSIRLAARTGGSQSGKPATLIGASAEIAADRARKAAEARAVAELRKDLDAGKRLLDGISRMISRFVVASPAMIDAMTLIAAQTYALDVLPTTLRALFTSEMENSGKTNAMLVLAALCSNPMDATGSSYALQSGFAANDNEHGAALTLYLDEVSSVFGTAGLGGARNNPVADVLRKGYKSGAKRAWSVNRTRVEYSIYGTFLMTGLRTAVPRDIRTRCIVFHMTAGHPEEYFSVRNGEPEAAGWARSLAQWVHAWKGEIGDFRARSLHPALEGRTLEVWEGCLAIAATAGNEWLTRGMAAFSELALDKPEVPILSPDQQLVRDLASVAKAMPLEPDGLAGGRALIDELKHLDADAYAGRAEGSLFKVIADVMTSLGYRTRQHRYGERRVRGYLAADIAAAWETVAPPPPVTYTAPERGPDIFEQWDDEDDAAYEAEVTVTGVTGVTGDESMRALPPGQHDERFVTDSDGETEVVDAELVDT
jgi:Protein of unknown function (DUF3631)